MIKFPSIGQYRNAVHFARECMGSPVVDYEGTVKLHGTNVGVEIHPDGTLFAQSRARVITETDDHHGFAKFVAENKPFFSALAMDKKFTLFGEWFGRGIMKGAGVSKMDKKRLSVFSAMAGECEFIDVPLMPSHDQIFSIRSFNTLKMRINFDHPELVKDKLEYFTADIERSCPVALKFCGGGIGEGIVWSPVSNELKSRTSLWFKVKGDKHKVTKRKAVEIDPVKVSTAETFKDTYVTENRVSQGVFEVVGEGFPTRRHTGEIIRWVFNDIIKEDLDTIKLTEKEMGKAVSEQARSIFFKMLDNTS